MRMAQRETSLGISLLQIVSSAVVVWISPLWSSASLNEITMVWLRLAHPTQLDHGKDPASRSRICQLPETADALESIARYSLPTLEACLVFGFALSCDNRTYGG